jgi:hypothetical protein
MCNSDKHVREGESELAMGGSRLHHIPCEPHNLGAKPTDANLQPVPKLSPCGSRSLSVGPDEEVAAITPGVSAQLKPLGHVRQIDERS